MFKKYLFVRMKKIRYKADKPLTEIIKEQFNSYKSIIHDSATIVNIVLKNELLFLITFINNYNE